MRELVVELVQVLVANRLPYDVRLELQSLVGLLQSYARLTTLQMESSERPLDDGPRDACTPKCESLQRIEELEERERERETELAEIRSLAKEVGFQLPPALAASR